MKLVRMIRHPFALVGQGFVLGGLLFVAIQDAQPAQAAPIEASAR